jgi:hypothetical protein
MTNVTNPLLFEMIRSFSALAKHLNLSHAVEVLGSTRQTVRRHIANLEEVKGVALFKVVDRRYELTDDGERALPEAEEILARGHAWLRGQSFHVNGLQYLTHSEPNGWFFHQQQHPLGTIWTQKSPIMREVFRSWAMGGGNIEADELQHIRPYLIVYRRTTVGWICVEFGDSSFYVRWFGQERARSNVGNPVGRMPGGEEFARMLDQSFHEVETTQNPRVDHVYTMVPRTTGGPLQTTNYKRLMLGGRFPDGSPALFSLVEPTVEIEIFGVDSSAFVAPDDDISLEFDLNLAKFGL